MRAMTHLSAEAHRSSTFLVSERMTDDREGRCSERTTQVTEVELVATATDAQRDNSRVASKKAPGKGRTPEALSPEP